MHCRCDYFYTWLLINLTRLDHGLFAVLLATKTFHPDGIKMDFLFFFFASCCLAALQETVSEIEDRCAQKLREMEEQVNTAKREHTKAGCGISTVLPHLRAD